MRSYTLLIFFLSYLLQGCGKTDKIEKECTPLENTMSKYVKLIEKNGNANYLLKSYLERDSSLVNNLDMYILSVRGEVDAYKNLLRSLNEPFLGEPFFIEDTNFIRCIYFPSFYAPGKCVTIAGVGNSYEVKVKNFSFIYKNDVLELILNDSSSFKCTNTFVDRIIDELHKAYFWDITRDISNNDMDPSIYIIEVLFKENRFEHYPNYHKVKKGNPEGNSFFTACNRILSANHWAKSTELSK